MVFAGPVVSSSVRVRDGALRNQVARTFGALCIDNESAGIAGAGVDFIVIRGIGDYCDAHASSDWDRYASASAVSALKYLLSCVSAVPPEWNEDSKTWRVVVQLEWKNGQAETVRTAATALGKQLHAEGLEVKQAECVFTIELTTAFGSLARARIAALIADDALLKGKASAYRVTKGSTIVWLAGSLQTAKTLQERFSSGSSRLGTYTIIRVRVEQPLLSSIAFTMGDKTKRDNLISSLGWNPTPVDFRDKEIRSALANG
jgi:hypothetical protein